MNGYLLGTTTIAGRTFTYDDVTEVRETGFDAGYYGGRVKNFGATKEGFLLCIEKNRPDVIDIFVNEDILTKNGLAMLLKHKSGEVSEKKEKSSDKKTEIEPGKKSDNLPKDIETMKHADLIKYAKELDIKGKIATMSGANLKIAIKEKLAENLREGE